LLNGIEVTIMSKKLSLGIIGHGFVGKAVEFGFDTENVEKFIVDPLHNTTIDDMFNHFIPDIVFIAVPTPMGEDGSINSSIIESVFHGLAKQKKKTIAVVKSTVTPNVITGLEKIYDRVVYNPEFLTERNANEDFIHSDFLILGGKIVSDLVKVKNIYEDYSKCDSFEVYYTDLEAASMVKYTMNCFMAAKVLFFNQIHSIYRASGSLTPWDQFVDIIKADKRMGTTHMDVPGPDGRFGYGGACFPKDTAALVRYASNINNPFTALEEVIQANQRIRNQYTELSDREKEQNVKFDI